MGEITQSPKPRGYRQKLRAAAAAATRQRIIEAARRCLTEKPLHNVSLDEIAVEAEVARSTIYGIFGSRAGLFEAVAEDVLARGGFDELGKAFRLPDVLAALVGSFQVAARLYSAEHAVGQALLSLAAVDRDAAGAAERMDRGRAEGMMDLAQRLADQHRLRPDVTPEEAADILWVLTSFETFNQLYTGRGLSPEEANKRIMLMLRSALYNEEALALSSKALP